jgi:tRNA (guanine37-N1)-methyltransferase
MRFDIVTIFPAMVREAFREGLLHRAREKGLIDVKVHDLRDWSTDRHRTVDDTPFGGGGGMVLRPEPIFAAVEALKARPTGSGRAGENERTVVALMCPQGRRLDQKEVRRLSEECDRLIMICGRYEGVDERVREHLVDLEISIGDYVLSGGELPALVVVEAVTRLIPGALGRSDSALQDSFSSGLLDFPHYTRPAEFRGWRVPDVLLSGDHGAVARWRREKSIERTRQRRPDLVSGASSAAPDGAAIKR